MALLLEETINQARRGEIEHRAAYTVGYLAGLLLKALDQGKNEERLNHLEAVIGHKAESQIFDFIPAKEQGTWTTINRD